MLCLPSRSCHVALRPKRGQGVMVAVYSAQHEDSAHARSVEMAAAAAFVAPWLHTATQRFTERLSKVETIAKKGAPTISVKSSLTHTQSYQMFVSSLSEQPFLLDDWLDLTSRPFVQGHMDALLAHPCLNTLLAADEELRTDVDAIIHNMDVALRKRHGVAWLVGIFAALAHFPGIYQMVEVADRAVPNDSIAAFEEEWQHRIMNTSIAEMRREVHVVRQMLSPLMLEMLLRFAETFVTAECVLWLAAMVDQVISDRDLLTSLSSGNRDSIKISMDD